MFTNIDEAKLKTLIGKKNFLLVDEAQKIDNVGNMLKITAEKFKDVSVIVTGSSAFKLRNDDIGRTFVQHYFWRTQQKKEIGLIEIEDGVMTGFEIKKKDGKRVSAPASFTTAYPNAAFKCITPSNLIEFLM